MPGAQREQVDPYLSICQSHLRWDVMILRRYNECALVPFSFSLNLCCWAGNWRMSHYCPPWIMRNWRRIWSWGVTAWKPSCCRLYAGYVPFSWSGNKKDHAGFLDWLPCLYLSTHLLKIFLPAACLYQELKLKNQLLTITVVSKKKKPNKKNPYTDIIAAITLTWWFDTCNFQALESPCPLALPWLWARPAAGGVSLLELGVPLILAPTETSGFRYSCVATSREKTY